MFNLSSPIKNSSLAPQRFFWLQRTAPTLLEGSYDFLKVLPENALALPSILQQSILSLLIEYIGWSSKSELPVRVHPLMYKRLESLLNLLLYSPVKDIKEQAYVLAKAAMSSSGAFDHNLREIGTWFLFLPGYSSNDLLLDDQWNNMRQGLFSAVITFLCEAVSTIGNSLFKEWDRLRSHIYHLTGRKGNRKLHCCNVIILVLTQVSMSYIFIIS